MNSNLVRVLKLAFWLLVILVGLLLIVFPLLTSLLIRAGQMPLEYLKFLSHVETAQIYLMRILGFTWLFFLGGCFASFLNVVAWRVPRGRGINGSSMCPACNSKLKFSDNLPVIGWIRNGGQCRHCRQPISPRYLIVEVILGSIFLLVCSLEILLGGINLPLREIERLQGFEHLVFAPKWDLIQLAIYHLVLVCFLFAFSLIRSEGLRIPISIVASGVAFGLALPLIWPAMLLVSWHLDVDHLIPLARFSQDQWITLTAGFVVGTVCGAIIYWAFQRESNWLNTVSTVAQARYFPTGFAEMLLVGIFLGWQSAISICILVLIISLAVNAVSSARTRRHFNLSTRILMATLLHLFMWRASTQSGIWPSQASPIVFVVAFGAVLAGLAAAIQKSRTEFPIEVEDLGR